MNKLFTLLLLFTVLNAYGQNAKEIARTGINSTVSIVALDRNSQPLGYGSGFIIDDELIATNVHVIEGSNSAYILKNGEEKKYTVSGYVAIDKGNDLVILKVGGLYGNKLPFGIETLPEIGEKIYAVGNPKGLNGTFSEGIISGIRDLATSQVLQITAPISPGSSGGPVLNSSGQVVGIAFASFTEGQNLNFAIPVKYLTILNAKIGNVATLSSVKVQSKPGTSTTSVTPNIKEGVQIRSISTSVEYDGAYVSYSIKNNLPYVITDIKIIILVYDNTGTVVDYYEEEYFKSYKYMTNPDGIKPFLAKTYNSHYFSWRAGHKFKLRILDFKINEAE